MAKQEIKTLAEFLAKRDITNITADITLPTIPFPIKIRAITKPEINNYTKQAKTDGGKINELIVLNHVVEPNLQSAEFLAQINCTNPIEALNKVFTAGEFLVLVEKISELSGFDDINKKIAQVKN